MNRFIDRFPLRTCAGGRTVSPKRFARWGWGHASKVEFVDGGSGVAAGLRVGALATCVLLAAACSSGESAGSNATSTTDPRPTTSEVAPTTTGPAFDSTTTPTDPTAPSTTVDPAMEADAAARAAVELAIADFSVCLDALPSCDPTTLAATRAEPMLAVNTGRITEWNAAGYRVIDRDQFRYVIESVELAEDLRQATVTVCFADGSKLVDPGAGPGGADLIIDGTFASGREAWDVQLDSDGVWRAHDAPLVGATEGTDLCAAG